jgi:uncharacterized protein (DUF1778 family)
MKKTRATKWRAARGTRPGPDGRTRAANVRLSAQEANQLQAAADLETEGNVSMFLRRAGRKEAERILAAESEERP